MTGLPELGRIEVLNLRDVWSNEPKIFNPWLAINLSVLGQAMGIELELETQEAPVGSFLREMFASVCQKTPDFYRAIRRI